MRLNRMFWAALVVISLLLCCKAQAQGGRLFNAPGQGWVNYYYPLFREGNRPPAARRYSQEYYWPSDVAERYPKFYGGFHSRYFDSIGRPSGDLGFRGYAW